MRKEFSALIIAAIALIALGVTSSTLHNKDPWSSHGKSRVSAAPTSAPSRVTVARPALSGIAGLADTGTPYINAAMPADMIAASLNIEIARLSTENYLLKRALIVERMRRQTDRESFALQRPANIRGSVTTATPRATQRTRAVQSRT